MYHNFGILSVSSAELQLGMGGPVLKSCGLPNKPIGGACALTCNMDMVAVTIVENSINIITTTDCFEFMLILVPI
jgi:hypothetical protein